MSTRLAALFVPVVLGFAPACDQTTTSRAATLGDVDGGSLVEAGVGDGSIDSGGALPQCSPLMPVTGWSWSELSGFDIGSDVITSIDASSIAGFQDITVTVSRGTNAHLLLGLGGLPLPFSVGDAIQMHVAPRGNGDQFGAELMVIKDDQTVLYVAAAEAARSAPVPLASGDAVCSGADSNAFLVTTQNSLVAFDGTTPLTIENGQARDVGAFRVFNDGTTVSASGPASAGCADCNYTYFHVAIVRTML